MNSLTLWEKAVDQTTFAAGKQEPVVYVKASAPVGRKEIGNCHLEPELQWEWNLVSTRFTPKVSVYLVWFLNYLEAPEKEHFSPEDSVPNSWLQTSKKIKC